METRDTADKTGQSAVGIEPPSLLWEALLPKGSGSHEHYDRSCSDRIRPAWALAGCCSCRAQREFRVPDQRDSWARPPPWGRSRIGGSA